jgi:nucleotide-binding universal stress UspA family protein
MKRILVAIDASPAHSVVLERALQVARGTDTKLVLFHAVATPTELPPEALAVSPGEVPKILLARAQADLGRMAERVPPSALAGVKVEIGTPWRAICEAAQREQADLIVVGSHGYGGLDRLLGTTAAKVVNHADCSVLVARPDRSAP